MLLNLVEIILGELPQDLRFLYAFGTVFILCIFLKLLFVFVNVIEDFFKSF